MQTYNYPVITVGGKVGIHSLRPAQCLAYINQLKVNGGRFPVVKAVDDIDWLADVKAIDPNIITIARFEIDGVIGEGANGVEFVNDGDYSEFVDTLFGPIDQKLRIRPDLKAKIDYWEICNEPDPPGADGNRKLAECMIACINRANSIGIKLGLFAFNAGTPEWWELEAIINTGVFGHARAGGHILTWHEAVFGADGLGFGAPIDLWFGQPIPATEDKTRWLQLFDSGLQIFEYIREEGNEPAWWFQGKAGPLMFRHRFLYERLRERDEVIPLVISEIVFGGGYANGISGQGVAQRAAWYEARAKDAYYLLGHLPFTLGGIGTGWDHQEYSFAYPALIDLMTSLRNRPNANRPAPVPTSVPQATNTPRPPTWTPQPPPPTATPRPPTWTPSPRPPTWTPQPPPPTATPRPPTWTPSPRPPTWTPVPPVPSWTPSPPVATWTPSPPVPTWTPSPSATATPIPPIPTSTPRPTPEPPPNLGFNVYLPMVLREPYDFGSADLIIHLLPKLATSDEKLRLVKILHDYRPTIVQSAIDARALAATDSENSLVVAWLANGWTEDIVAFMGLEGVSAETRILPNTLLNQPSISPYEDPDPAIINLIPFTATPIEKQEIVTRTHNERQALTQSETDAIAFAKLGTEGSRVRVWEPDRWNSDILQFLRDNGVWVEEVRFWRSPPPSTMGT